MNFDFHKLDKETLHGIFASVMPFLARYFWNKPVCAGIAMVALAAGQVYPELNVTGKIVASICLFGNAVPDKLKPKLGKGKDKEI